MGSKRHCSTGGEPGQIPIAVLGVAAAHGSKFKPQSQLAKFRLMFRQMRGCARVLASVGVFLALALSSAIFGDEPSPAANSASHIGLNTVGYLPQASKCATIVGSSGEAVVRDAKTGSEVLRIKLRQAGESSSGAPPMLADFSALHREGTYRLSVPGVADSAEFRIARDVYNWPLYCTVRAMYLWRCGCKVHGELAGETFSHQACHTEDAYLDFVGGPVGEHKDGAGGWHDAGDYNKYTVNGAFTAGMMLQAWEDFHEQLKPLTFDVPESTNSSPDYLDEVRWELDWLLKMQADDGRVYHKVSTFGFCGFISPDKETAKRYFSPWGSAATASFAAVMAQAARVYRPFDVAYADRCLAAARKSYDFLAAHPEDHRPDLSAFSTGGYDSADADKRLWMAAELWETTDDAKYLQDLERRIESYRHDEKRSSSLVESNWDWNNARNLGLFTYLLSKRSNRNAQLLDAVRNDAIRHADDIPDATRREPYGRTLGSRYQWGCNGTEVRLAMNLHIAQVLTGDKKYEAAMLDGINHVFGRNVHGRSYVTGIGYRPPMFPHDRRSSDDDVVAPWPGYLVGGPWPKATDWHDDREDYKTNEIAINWNGALIYALSAFVEPRSFDASIRAAKGTASVERGEKR
jgi:endoglucanase